jgi:hypothetical protein
MGNKIFEGGSELPTKTLASAILDGLKVNESWDTESMLGRAKAARIFCQEIMPHWPQLAAELCMQLGTSGEMAEVLLSEAQSRHKN